MAKEKELVPIIGIDGKNPQEVSTLSDQIIKGAYANTETYPDIPVEKGKFSDSRKLLGDLIVDGIGNTKLKNERVNQCDIQYAFIVKIHDYVLPICKGFIELINQSGFKPSNVATKHPAPDQPVIEKITPGKLFGTFKIFLKRRYKKNNVNEDPVTSQRGVKYNIQITLTPDINSSWVLVAGGLASTKLLFSNFTPKVVNYVRVIAVNAAGESQPSIPYPIIGI